MNHLQFQDYLLKLNLNYLHYLMKVGVLEIYHLDMELCLIELKQLFIKRNIFLMKYYQIFHLII